MFLIDSSSSFLKRISDYFVSILFTHSFVLRVVLSA